MRILFVCLGNICRSPSAEGVMRGLVREADLEDEFEVDSAGTGNWHVGEAADGRAVKAAAGRGVTLDCIARQVMVEDFERFDLLVAMDRENRTDLRNLAPNSSAMRKIRLLREYADGAGTEVPDPYYSGDDGFEEVLDILERSCSALLNQVVASKAA